MIASALIFLLILLVLYVGSHRLSGSQTVLTVSVFAVGVLLVVFPMFAEDIAHLLNVGRGADVVIYFSIMCGMFISANFYFRFKRDEQRMIEVVRTLALLSAVGGQSDTTSMDGQGSIIKAGFSSSNP